MARLNINLSEELRTDAEARAAEDGHATVEAYVEALIREDLARGQATAPDPDAPAHLSFRNQEELEALLLEGLQSGPAVEATPEFWEDLKRRALGRRRQAGQGG